MDFTPMLLVAIGFLAVVIWLSRSRTKKNDDGHTPLDVDYFFSTSFVNRKDVTVIVNVTELFRTKVTVEREDCDPAIDGPCQFDMTIKDFKYHFKPLE